MQDSTPKASSLSPKEKTVEFITYFAHHYRYFTMPDNTVREWMLG